MMNRLFNMVTLIGIAQFLLVTKLAFSAGHVSPNSSPRPRHASAECRLDSITPILNLPQSQPLKQLAQSLQEIPPNTLSSESCISHNYRAYEVKKILQGWEKRGSEDHAEIARMFDMVIFANAPERPLDSNIFLICDSQGEIYSIGRYEQSESKYLNLSLLISSPDLNKRGGGKAAIKHIMRQSILKNKEGINLTALPGAYGFYTRMGFTPIPGDWENVDEVAGGFTIDRSGILKILKLDP